MVAQRTPILVCKENFIGFRGTVSVELTLNVLISFLHLHHRTLGLLKEHAHVMKERYMIREFKDDYIYCSKQDLKLMLLY